MISWAGIVAAAILNATFAVPMKGLGKWKFHQIWALFSVLAMTAIPWAAVLLAVPEWKSSVAAIPFAACVRLMTLGLLWGVTALLYGLALDLLGIALGFSIQQALSIVFGALIPFVSLRGIELRRGDGGFLLGIGTLVVGVVVCALAGRGPQEGAGRQRFRVGLVVAILGGLGSPLLNFGIGYGISLLPQSAHGGRGQWVAWAIFLSASTVSQVAICIYKITTAKEWRLFRSPGKVRAVTLVVAMSLLWTNSIFVYGVSIARLGKLGAGVGWPVFIALIVVVSNTWGIALGEWKQRSGRDLYQMLAGCTVLIWGTFVIAQAQAAW